MNILETTSPNKLAIEELEIVRLVDIAERGKPATDIRGNPLVELDLKAEARLVRKLDLYLLPTVALLYLFCFIDRANIGNARLGGFEKDLGLSGYDYNTILSIFYVSYILLEIPANALCKRIGPGWFLPATTLAFGVCSIATAFVTNLSQACAVRFLLGVFEAGSMPGIAYYLSRWYRRSELAFRLAMYLVMAPLAGAFGGLLASAILTLSSFGLLRSWRMIFAIEGIATVVISIVAFFTLTDRPSTARWLSEEERDLCIARIKSERVGTTTLLDKANITKTIRGILNPVTLFCAVLFFCGGVTTQGLAFFAPTVVRTIYPHASIVKQQLYTVPPYVVGSAFTLIFPLISWKMDRRRVIVCLAAPLTIAGYILFLASTDARVRYGAMFLSMSTVFTTGPMLNAQVSANVVTDSARSSAIGFIIMFANIGGLVSSWSFLPFDAPNYYIGNGLNLGIQVLWLVTSITMLLWTTYDNNQRDKRDINAELREFSEEEMENLDWKHPGFRWAP